VGEEIKEKIKEKIWAATKINLHNMQCDMQERWREVLLLY